MQDDYGVNGPAIELDSGEWAIEPDQPTKGTSCLRYCPYCGEAVLAMEPKCCYCGEVIDMPLRLAEEAKRIAEEATRRPAIVAAPAPTSTRQPMDWSDFWCHVLGFLFMAGWGWTAWKLHVVLGLSWPWALALPVVLFLLMLFWLMLFWNVIN